MGTFTTFKSFNESDWEKCEAKCSEEKKRVIDCLLNLGNNINDIDKEINILKILDQEYYKELRDILIKDYFLINIFLDIELDKKDNVKKQDKKINKIKEENNKRIIKLEFDNIIKEYSKTIFIKPNLSFMSNYIDFRCFGLLYCGTYILFNKNFYTSKQYDKIYNIICAIQRFILIIENMEFKDFYNNKLKPNNIIKDLKILEKNMIETFNYNSETIFKYTPDLPLSRDFDVCYPVKLLKIRNHQKDIYNKVSSNLSKEFLILYQAPLGTGKSISFIPLSSCINKLSENIDKTIYQILFVCSIETVREEIANCCSNADIGFGLGIEKRKNKKDHEGMYDDYEIIRSYLARSSKYEIKNKTKTKSKNRFEDKKYKDLPIIITTPKIARKIILDQRKDKKNIKNIIFLDEPTIGADDINNEVLKETMLLLSIFPERLILSSATFPQLSYINPILDEFKSKYKDIYIDSVYSSKIHIGFEVITFNGKVIRLHKNVKNKEDIKKIIKYISLYPLLNRFYITKTLKELIDSCEKFINLDEEFKINNFFTNINNLNINIIKKKTIKLLELICNESDDIIEKIFKNINYENKKDFNLEFKLLGTTKSNLMPTQTLIASNNPIKFALENFKENIDYIRNFTLTEDDIEFKPYKKFKDVLTNFDKSIDIYEKEMESREKRMEMKKKKEKTSYRSLNEQKDFINNILSRPVLNFPLEFQINTEEHMKKYSIIKNEDEKFRDGLDMNIISNMLRGPKEKNCSDIKKKKKTPKPDLIKNIINVDDDILLLLFMGVGISCVEDKLDKTYKDIVSYLALRGSLAYLISDTSLCFGVNYPINRIIITDDFSDSVEILRLYQLMGRAGRSGLSNKAEIFVSEKCSEKIISPDEIERVSKLESNNMNTVFKKIIEENKIIIKPIPDIKPIITVKIDKEKNIINNDNKEKLLRHKKLLINSIMKKK